MERPAKLRTDLLEVPAQFLDFGSELAVRIAQDVARHLKGVVLAQDHSVCSHPEANAGLLASSSKTSLERGRAAQRRWLGSSEGGHGEAKELTHAHNH